MTILTGGASVRLSTLERELGKAGTAYIAGPMRGMKDFNYPAFNAASDRLYDGGWAVFNPADTDSLVQGRAEKSDNPLAVYMEQDLPDVCRSDVIFCLDGWENSEGARLEVEVARRLGKRLYTFPDIRALDEDIESPVNRILEYVKPNGEPVIQDLCVCGPLNRATRGCSCAPMCRILGCDHPRLPSEDTCVEHKETILQEADRLVSSDRGSQYGHPADDFGKVTRMAKALWGRGPETPAEHALYMILLKVARLEATPGHRDSIVDIAGYAKTYEMVMERMG